MLLSNLIEVEGKDEPNIVFITHGIVNKLSVYDIWFRLFIICILKVCTSISVLYYIISAISNLDSGFLGCSVRLYLQLFVGGLMSYLLYLCLFAYSGVQDILCCVFFVFVLCLMYGGVQHILCCVFCLFLSSSFVWYTQYCQFLWIIHSWLPLRFL